MSDDDGRDRVAGGENNQGVHQSQLEGGNTPEIKFLLQIGFYNILIFWTGYLFSFTTNRQK